MHNPGHGSVRCSALCATSQINKMDDPSIITPDGKWSEERYNEIHTKLSSFLKTCGYREKDVIYLPMSGLLGLNIKDPVPKETCPWNKVHLPNHHPILGKLVNIPPF